MKKEMLSLNSWIKEAVAWQQPLDEFLIDYNMRELECSQEDLLAKMQEMLDVMEKSVEHGLTGVRSHSGLTGGDAKKLATAAGAEGFINLLGEKALDAVIYATAVGECNAAMGRIVAAPTGGSAGIVPGCLLTVQEDKGYSDEELIRALFAAAAAGIGLYYHEVSFSGMGGGCQGEIGVSSAIAASALAYLGGADTEGCCHAMALAMKNILGLVCDRIAGSSEIPCTTRNCIGVANAFAGCDMALAGIKSAIDVDKVYDAMRQIGEMMDKDLKETGKAGLAQVAEQ